MSDVNAYLPKALDGIAPTYKKRDEEEFGVLEGTGGAIYTKNVNTELAVISSTTPLESNSYYSVFGEEYLNVLEYSEIRFSIYGNFSLSGSTRVVVNHKTWHGDSTEVLTEVFPIIGSRGSFTIKPLSGFMEIRVVNEGTTDRNIARMSVIGVSGGSGTADVDLSYTEDEEGEKVLRTVDAAPFAYDSYNDTKKVSIHQNQSKIILLTNNTEIRNTSRRYFRTIDVMSPQEFTQYKNIAISVEDTHDANAIEFRIFPILYGATGVVLADTEFYSNSDLIKSGTERYYFQGHPGGDGAESAFITVPPLVNNVFYGLAVSIRFETDPTSGSLTIGLVMNS